MIKRLHNFVLLFAVLWSLVLFPQTAWAQTASLTCSGGTVASGEFFFDDPGVSGSACEFINSQVGLQHIFSEIICKFVTMLNNVLGQVYCGMQDLLQTMVGAVLTIYVAIFGAQMLMGTTEANAREFMTRLFKIAFVWIFVSQSAWGVQFAFNFFVQLSGQGVEWVMASIPALPPPSGQDPSGFSLSIDCYDPAANTVTGFMAAFTRLDRVMCEAVTGPLVILNSKLIGFFIVLCLLVPPIGFLALSWLWLNLKILVQGLITFLLGIASLAFLIAMSPIFLSLMLFKATAGFFENWLKYMMSFSLQIILVFACVALWLTVTIHFIDFFKNLSETIFLDGKVIAKAADQTPSKSWGVCPFRYYADSSTVGPDYPPGPLVKCQTENFNPDAEPVVPISSLLWADNTSDKCQLDVPIPLAPANDCTKYLYYVVYHLITLIIVTFAFEALLREAPMIAVYLAGPDYTPPLTGGFGISRAGQVRSLFSSSGSSSAANAEGGGFSFRKMAGELFGSNPTTPAGSGTAATTGPRGVNAPPGSGGTVASTREQMSSLATSGRPPTA